MAVLPTITIPLEAQYLYRQSLDLSMEGKKEEALAGLKKVVFIAPRFCNAYNAMGNCLDELGRYEEAIRKYEIVLGIDPHHAEARFKRALVIGKIDRIEAAGYNTGNNTVKENEPDEHHISLSSGKTQNRVSPFMLLHIWG